MGTTAAIYRRVETAVRSIEGPASSLIGIAQLASRAGANVFRTIGLVLSLPQRAKALLGQVAAAYTNVFCLLRNAVRRLPQYDDYSDLYGASNCSSTSGGRGISPFVGTNTFAAVSQASAQPDAAFTTGAQASLQSLAKVDPVLAPPTITSLVSSLQQVNLGTSIA
jgi:hypothetical protein